MSLITLVATKELISIMSDGRLCEGDKVYQEDFKKIAMISDNIVLGATGNHEEAKSLLANAAEWLESSEDDIDSFVNVTREKVLKIKPKNHRTNITPMSS